MKAASIRRFNRNTITPMRRVWTLAHIPANVRAAIDREAAKWGISTGDAIARIMRRELAAHERAEGRGALYRADILGKGVAA